MGTIVHRILLVDDHPIVRLGLRYALSAHPHFQILGEAANGREGVRLALALVPNVILMDLTMPELNGWEATRQIVRADPQIRVLAFSMHAGSTHVNQALEAGAAGYLLKNCAKEELVEAIETVLKGKSFLSPGATNVVVPTKIDGQASDAQGASLDTRLTPREREVLQLVSEGMSSKQVAMRLLITTKTVEGHRLAIMKRLSLQSVAELTRYAILKGISPLEHAKR